MNNLFTRHSFKIILVVIFVLPFMTRGGRLGLKTNENKPEDWLPAEYEETQAFQWFKQHFENETFILASWEGCTLDDTRLQLFAEKLVLPPYDEYFKKVETGPALVDRLTQAPVNLSEEDAIKRIEGLFVGPDGKQSCAVITLTDHAKTDLRTTVDKIYAVTQNELGITRDRLRLGGPAVDSVAISVEGEKTLIRLFGPAAIVGVSLAFWCLRSVRLTTMVFSVAVYAAAVSISIVYYSQGTMNAILLTMPAVVYVAAISGAIHFSNYYRDEAVEGGVAGAPVRAIKSAWLPCTLSAVTTSAGLASLYTSELIPIKYFGIYSALGVISTLVLLFFFLPAWMQLWPMKSGGVLDGHAPKKENVALPAHWRRFLGGAVARYPLVLGGLVAVMIFCGIGLTKVNTSIKLTKLFSSDAEIIHHYQWLEERLGPLVPMEVVIRLNNEQAQLTLLERMQLIQRIETGLEQVEGVGNTISAVTFAPDLTVKRRGLLPATTMASVLNKKLEEHREEFIQSGLLAVEGDEELWRISARVGALNDIDYGAFIDKIKSGVDQVLTVERAQLAERNAASDSGVELVSQAPDDETQGLAATYTGLVPVVYKAQRAMLVGLAWNFVTDLLTIAAVMTIVFWDLAAGLILLIPSIFPVVVVFGLMGWMGVVIDVGTIMTPTVALGVSVDDVMHFLIWYRRGLAAGKTRREAIMLAYEDCARPMYQSWSVLGLGLVVFALSSFVPTQRFGALMFTLLSAALIGNLFLLPAVLASPLSWLFLRRVVRKAKNRPAAEPVEAAEPAVLVGIDSGESAVPAPARMDASKRLRA